MAAFKESQQNCYNLVDPTCVVKLKCIKFDKLVATTPKAILIAKGADLAWVPRSTIEELGTEDGYTMFIWIPLWLDVQWAPKTTCQNVGE